MSNSDYKIKYVAPSKKFALALDAQTFIPLNLKSTRSLTESDENIFVINAAEETNVEKNENTKYRIQGKLEIITDNTIFEAWSQTPVSDDAWTPVTEGIGLDRDGIPRNWLLTITYPFSSDDEKNIAATTGNSGSGPFETKASEGFQIVELLPYNYKSGITNILIRTAQKHGIVNLDDGLYISPKNNFINDGVDTKNYLGFHQILDFEPGNEDFGLILSTEYIIPTTLDAFGNPIVVKFLGVGKRVFEPSLNDITFFSPVGVTKIEKSNFSGGTNGDVIYTKIFSPEHFLRVNDFVEVRTDGLFTPGSNPLGSVNITMPNLYKVVATPTPDTFIIKYDFPWNPPSLIPFDFILDYKYVDGVPSEYYYRKNKILTEPKDYEVYKAAFSVNIFNDGYIDDVFLFHFDKDIDVAGLTDNLGRPLSQLYLTILKRAGNGCRGTAVGPNQPGYCDGEAYDGFGPWANSFQLLENNRKSTPILSSQDSEVIEVLSYWQNQDPNTAGTYKQGNATYYNDFVEYNRAFLDERILAETVNKTGPIQVYPVPNTSPQAYEYDSREGYTHKTHYEISIRKFSTTIETVTNSTNEIYPDYAQINNDGTVSWRDLLPIGFFEPDLNNTNNGIDYPFVNSKHYLFGEYPIYIRRQTATQLAQDQLILNKFVKFNTNSTPNDEC